jgi:hypothetical protein
MHKVVDDGQIEVKELIMDFLQNMAAKLFKQKHYAVLL